MKWILWHESYSPGYSPKTYSHLIDVLHFELTNSLLWWKLCLRKQPTFGDAAIGFPATWRLRNERRNSTLMTRHYSDLGRASDWSSRVGNLIQPIRSATQIWLVTSRQYGISALVSQTSYGGETTGGVANCRLFSQTSGNVASIIVRYMIWV